MNYDLLFFCTMCREKSEEDISKIKCTINHSVKYYKRGEYIAREGDKIMFLKMLTKGRVKTEVVSDSGLTLSVEELSAPYPLAAAFLFADNDCFPINVIAMEDCEILLISKKTVELQMSKCAGFLRGFMAFNANRMQCFSERLKVFAQKSIKAKVAYYILGREKNGVFEMDRTISSLSEYFGVERPSLSRAISEMIHSNIIEYSNGKGKILDYDALHNILL